MIKVQEIYTRYTENQSKELYRQIVETSYEGILVCDLEARITFINERISEIFGFDQKEMLPKLQMSKFVWQANMGRNFLTNQTKNLPAFPHWNIHRHWEFFIPMD